MLNFTGIKLKADYNTNNMIDYKLAKKLKEAGFEQKGNGTVIDEHDNVQTLRTSGFQLYSPTLSELIEACGESFDSLTLCDGDWRADGIDPNIGCVVDCCGELGQGSTPEEAVANLWLELNKLD
jgi:hypothetical protein